MNKFRMKKAGIDVNHGLQRLFGDTELYESLLLKFLDDTHYQDMKAAVEKGDVEAAFSAAHSLKGVAGNLSMTTLFDAVVPVVETFRAGSLAVAEQMTPVDQAYDMAIAAIQDMKK